MKSSQRRLLNLEDKLKEKQELCIAIFWVRKGPEEEDSEKQRTEFKEYFKDLPDEKYYQTLAMEAPEKTYEDFMQYVRKGRSFEQWWSLQTIKGIPCNDYKDALKELKKS